MCRTHHEIHDSKGTAARSAEAATQAILQGQADLLFARGTPGPTKAPSDSLKRNHVPRPAIDTPVEAWLFGPDGTPKTHQCTDEVFSGPDLVANHIGMIESLPDGFDSDTGHLWSNDADGPVFAQIFRKKGRRPTDPRRFQRGFPDSTSAIDQFKRDEVQAVMGAPAPPDRQNHLQRAAQADFKSPTYSRWRCDPATRTLSEDDVDNVVCPGVKGTAEMKVHGR